jgi:uncharacterized protein (DUF2252 family)
MIARAPSRSQRQRLLDMRRKAKMARSAHAFVRGSTKEFYEWLEGNGRRRVPDGPYGFAGIATWAIWDRSLTRKAAFTSKFGTLIKPLSGIRITTSYA